MKKFNLLIVFFFSFFFFNIPVFARVEGNINWNVPDEDQLNTDSPFITNLEIEQQSITYNTCEMYLSYTQIDSNLSTLQVNTSNIINSRSNNRFWHDNFYLYNSNYDNSGTFLTNFTFYFDDSRYCNNYKLEKDKHYEILVQIQKSSDLNFYLNSDTINLNSDTITFYGAKPGNNYDINISDYVNISSVAWVPPILLNTDSDDYSYIHIKFSINDLLDSDYLQFSKLSLDSGDFSGNISQQMNSSSSFLFNTDSDSHVFKIRSFSLIEGYITLSGFNESSSGGGYSNGGGHWDNLDNISENDLSIFNNEILCDDNDIVCHLKNGINYFKNMLTRFWNFVQGLGYAIYGSIINALKYLFIPDPNEFSSKISSISGSLTNQFGFIYDSFSLIANFLNRFLHISDLQTNIIHIPVIKEPFNDVVLYSGGDFNIGDIFNSNALYNLYRIYRIFISAFLVISFLNYCKKVLMSIVGNVTKV